MTGHYTLQSLRADLHSSVYATLVEVRTAQITAEDAEHARLQALIGRLASAADEADTELRDLAEEEGAHFVARQPPGAGPKSKSGGAEAAESPDQSTPPRATPTAAMRGETRGANHHGELCCNVQLLG